MVDIHFHLLPGLDDGPDTLEMALEMAERAAADGTTHIVATPHANPNFLFDSELIAQRAAELRSKVGDRLKIFTGCDFHLSFENLQDIQKHPQRYTIDGKGYLLVEFAAGFSIVPLGSGIQGSGLSSKAASGFSMHSARATSSPRCWATCWNAAASSGGRDVVLWASLAKM